MANRPQAETAGVGGRRRTQESSNQRPHEHWRTDVGDIDILYSAG